MKRLFTVALAVSLLGCVAAPPAGTSPASAPASAVPARGEVVMPPQLFHGRQPAVRPRVRLTPEAPAPGETVTVEGAGVPPEADIELWVGPVVPAFRFGLPHPGRDRQAKPVGTARADAAGRFTATFTMTDGQPPDGTSVGSVGLWLTFPADDTIAPYVATWHPPTGPVASPSPFAWTIDPWIRGRYGVAGEAVWQPLPGRRPLIYPLGPVTAFFVPGTDEAAARAIVTKLGGRLGAAAPAVDDRPAWLVDFVPDVNEVLPNGGIAGHDGFGADFGLLAGRMGLRGPLAFTSLRAAVGLHRWLRAHRDGPLEGLVQLLLPDAPCPDAACAIATDDPYQPAFDRTRGAGERRASPTPRVVLAPAVPAPGETVTVTGEGAPPGEPVEAWLTTYHAGGFKAGLMHPGSLAEGERVGTATADAAGRFTLAFPLAPLLPAAFDRGDYGLWLTFPRRLTIAPYVAVWQAPLPEGSGQAQAGAPAGRYEPGGP